LHLVFTPRPDLSKPVISTSSASDATVARKKELRVVHINELELSQPTPAMVKGPRRKAGGLRFGLAPQESFHPSTTFAGPEPLSILELKHAQNP
jgi:hypothetical protein